MPCYVILAFDGPAVLIASNALRVSDGLQGPSDVSRNIGKRGERHLKGFLVLQGPRPPYGHMGTGSDVLRFIGDVPVNMCANRCSESHRPQRFKDQ